MIKNEPMQNPFRRYMDACYRNDVSVVKDNLSMVGVNYQDPVAKAQNYNGVSNYSTGLIVAVSNKSNDVARFLLSQPNINVNLANIVFATALHVAVLDDNEEMVEELIKRKDIVTTMKTVHGDTPHNYASDKPNILNLFRKFSIIDIMEKVNFSKRMEPVIISPPIKNYLKENFYTLSKMKEKLKNEEKNNIEDKTSCISWEMNLSHRRKKLKALNFPQNDECH